MLYTQRNSSRSVFASRSSRRRSGDSRRETHRAEETGATWKTRRPATSGSKVKTIAYNWHMKFKGGIARRAGGRPVAHSIYPWCSSPYSFLVLPPRWKFTFPPCSARTVCLSRFLLKSRWWLRSLSYSHTPLMPP